MSKSIKVGVSTVGRVKTLKCDRCGKKVDALSYVGKEKVCNDCFNEKDMKKIKSKFK